MLQTGRAICKSFGIENRFSQNICKFISNKCKDEIFKLKNLIRTSYAKEIAINSEKQLKLIVLNYDFLSNHVLSLLFEFLYNDFSFYFLHFDRLYF